MTFDADVLSASFAGLRHWARNLSVMGFWHSFER